MYVDHVLTLAYFDPDDLNKVNNCYRESIVQCIKIVSSFMTASHIIVVPSHLHSEKNIYQTVVIILWI